MFPLTQVFLPAHNDQLLLSLHRPKVNRPSSPTGDALLGRSSSSTHEIDVRTLTLRSFRDAIILPIHTRLYNVLASAKRGAGAPSSDNSNGENGQRLQQMYIYPSEPYQRYADYRDD